MAGGTASIQPLCSVAASRSPCPPSSRRTASQSSARQKARSASGSAPSASSTGPGLGVSRPGLRLADGLDQHPVEVLAEDLVVAERVVGVLDGDREHAPPGELVEQRAAARRSAQPIAQRPRQPAQHAGVDEELAQVLGQPEQHVLGEVLAQQPAAHLGPAQHPPPLVGRPAARREVEQLEARRPALGPACEDREVARQHGVVVDVAEQLLDLPGPEPQVVGPELQQLARDPEPGQVDRRRDAARDDQREPRRGVVDEAPQRALGVRALQRMAVVDDERGRGDRPRLEGLRDVLDARPAAGQLRERGPQGRLEMSDERALVGVPGLGAVPADGDGGLRGEPRHERRLARPGRRDDERQPMAPRIEEARLEPLTGQGVRRRHPDLRGYHERHGDLRPALPCSSRTSPVSQSPPSTPESPVAGLAYGAPRWASGPPP